MSESENTTIIRGIYDSFLKGDIPGLLGALDDGIEWHVPVIDNVPFSGSISGRANVEQFFKTLSDDQEPVKFDPREFIAQGDRVVVLGDYTWHVKSTDKNFGGDWAHVWSLRDGKPTSFKEYADTHAAALAHQKTMAA